MTNPSLLPLYRFIIILIVLFLMGIICEIISCRCFAYISENISKKLREKLFDKFQYFPIEHVDSGKAGEVVSLYSNDIENIKYFTNENHIHY